MNYATLSKRALSAKCSKSPAIMLKDPSRKIARWKRSAIMIWLSCFIIPAQGYAAHKALSILKPNHVSSRVYQHNWITSNFADLDRWSSLLFIKLAPQLLPLVPSTDHWSGAGWLDQHAKLVRYVTDNKGPIDILLVGDSNTKQLGSPLDSGKPIDTWQRHFAMYHTINIGLDGDKTQNLLWRLQHGSVTGLQPRVVILMIGSNNMFYTSETGVDSVANGIKACALTLHSMLPMSEIIVVKLLPATSPGYRMYNDIMKTNASIDRLHFNRARKIHVVNLTNDFLNTDGSLKKTLFRSDEFHLSTEGYEVFTRQLKPIIEWALDHSVAH